MKRIEAISNRGCFFEYYGTVKVLGTNKVRHIIRIANPKDDVFANKTIEDADWKGLRAFMNQYFGL